MKLQVAIAAVAATECLSREQFSLPFKSRDISENGANRRKMIQVLSELNKESGTRRKPVLQKLREERQQQGQLQSPQANADGLDLGILGSVSATADTGGTNFDFDQEYRRLDQIYLGVCPPTEEIKEYFKALHYNPRAIPFQKLCNDFQVYNVCNTCEFPQVMDPETGVATGAYHVKIDCPGLVGLFDGANIAPLDQMCNQDQFCPGCGSICESCEFFVDAWFVNNENCFISDDLRNAYEEFGGPPADADEAVDNFMYNEGAVPLFFPACGEDWVGDFEGLNASSIDEAFVDEESLDDEETLVDESLVDEETLVDESSIDEAADEEVPSEEASVEEAAVDEASADETLDEETSSGKEPVEEVVPSDADSEIDTNEQDGAAATSAGEMSSTHLLPSTILCFVLTGASVFWVAA